MTPQKEKELIEKIVEAVPGIKEMYLKSSYYESGDGHIAIQKFTFEKIERDFTLEDILIATKNFVVDVYVNVFGDIYRFDNKWVGTWKLGKPLSQQSEELKECLYSVIVGKTVEKNR